MSIERGTNTVKNVKRGSIQVKKICRGSILIWSAVQTGTLESYVLSESMQEQGDETKTYTKIFSGSYKFLTFQWGQEWKAVEGAANPVNFYCNVYGTTDGGSSWTLLNSCYRNQNFTGNSPEIYTVSFGNQETYFNGIKLEYWADGATSNSIRQKILYFRITEWGL